MRRRSRDTPACSAPLLAWLAAVLAVVLISGMIGRPQDPAIAAYMAFAAELLWFVAAGITLVLRPDPMTPASEV